MAAGVPACPPDDRRPCQPRGPARVDGIRGFQGREPPGQALVAGDLEFGPDLTDPDQHLGPERARRRLRAAPLHQPLHGLFQAVFTQARPALIKMLADLGESLVLDLTVEVVIQACQYLATRHVMWLAAAHPASVPGSSPDDDASVGAVDAARTRPSLAA